MSQLPSPENTQQSPEQSLRSRYESVRPSVKRAVEKAFQRERDKKDIRTIREGAFHAAEELQREAYIDTLTGLYRRKPFQDATEKAMENATRNPSAGVSMSFLDLDDYGRFNKDLGETAGDTTLTLTGETVKSSVRKTDIAGRWGGEEIAVVHPYEKNTTSSPIEISERIRQRIQDMNIPLKDGAINEHITTSIGATEYVPGESFDEFRERAGVAMRLAKFFGKNRTVHAEKRDDGRLNIMDYKTGELYIYESELVESESSTDNKQLREYLFDIKDQVKIQIERKDKGYKRKIVEVFDEENPMKPSPPRTTN